MNILTHLSYERIKKLASAGTGFDEAIKQAELELIAALQVGPPGYEPSTTGSQMNILGGDTDDNAYLFAVSAVLVQVAVTEGGNLDATLQQLINTMSLDLADDGLLQVATVKKLQEAQKIVDTRAIMQALSSWLAGQGSSITIANIEKIIDTDFDGIVNFDDDDDDEDDDDNDGVLDEEDAKPLNPTVGNIIYCDDISGLCWQTEPSIDRLNYQQTVDYCQNLEIGGHDDWNLPSVNQLRTFNSVSKNLGWRMFHWAPVSYYDEARRSTHNLDAWFLRSTRPAALTRPRLACSLIRAVSLAGDEPTGAYQFLR
ncbi:MAG: hypothetical protein V2A73_22410 [Pseudomonadota bacterium]